MKPADRRHLSIAFELAERGLGATSPNPAVGAVVVRDGEVVGRGYHARAGEDHAETIALREAAGLARGADLFLNLEPCCWHRLLEGRSPSCVEQILAAGIRRVVAATRDPNPAIDGRGLRMLAEAGVAIEPEDPFFARRAARLNEVFFKYVVTKRPFVVLKAGMTLDGRIALAGGASRWITGEQARAEARALRERHDAVLVGIGTVLADDPLLLPGEGSRRPAPPVRVVLDSRLRLPAGSRLARSADRGGVLVFASVEADGARARALEACGVAVVRTGKGRPDPGAVLAELGARELTSVLVEGGGEVLGSFLRGGHADKAHLFIAPRLMGGRESIPAFGGEGPPTIGALVDLSEVELRRAGGALVVTGYPRRA